MLTVGDNDRNEVSCRETASRPGWGLNLPCDQESNTFTAELSVLILFKMIESIDMTLCVISFLVYINFSFKISGILSDRIWDLVGSAASALISQ